MDAAAPLSPKPCQELATGPPRQQPLPKRAHTKAPLKAPACGSRPAQQSTHAACQPVPAQHTNPHEEGREAACQPAREALHRNPQPTAHTSAGPQGLPTRPREAWPPQGPLHRKGGQDRIRTAPWLSGQPNRQREGGSLLSPKAQEGIPSPSAFPPCSWKGRVLPPPLRLQARGFAAREKPCSPALHFCSSLQKQTTAQPQSWPAVWGPAVPERGPWPTSTVPRSGKMGVRLAEKGRCEEWPPAPHMQHAQEHPRRLSSRTHEGGGGCLCFLPRPLMLLPQLRPPASLPLAEAKTARARPQLLLPSVRSGPGGACLASSRPPVILGW